MKDGKEARWPRWLAGAVLIAIGAVLLVGGVRLLTLGGSAYYLLAGLACTASGALLWKGDGRGLWLYAAMLLGTVIWAFWEVGVQFWQLLPRLAGPTVIGAVLVLPWLRRRLTSASDAGTRWGPGAVVLVAALALLGTFLTVPVFDVSPGRVDPLAPVSPGSAEWTDYGANLSGTRHSPAAQITPVNAAKLKQAWSFKTGDTKAKRPEIKSISFMATPLMVDDKVVFCSPTGKVFALDADTGRQIWLRDPHTQIGNAQMLNCRGVSYHADPAATGICARRILSMTVDGRFLASDLATGAPCPDFGKGGTVNLDEGLGDVDPFRSYTSSPPVIVGNTAILGAYVRDNYTKDDPSGVVRAFDVKSGKLLWAWDSGRPDDAPPLKSGEKWTRGSVNAWTAFSADPALGLVYVPTGNATPDHVGTHRSPMLERYASSIVALDVTSGRVRWAFQSVHHDLWDYDLPAQPSAVNFVLKGRKVAALIVPTKRGEIFVLDRATGKPLTPVEERPVPRGNLPGERYSPTQPYPTGFASFAPAPLTEAGMWGATPLDQMWCRIRFRSLDYKGMFTPPSERGILQWPGTFGILNWGGVSIDPERNLMIVNSAAIPQEVRLFRHGANTDRPAMAKDSHAPGYLPQYGTNYGVSLLPMFSPLGIPCAAPPWGKLAAVDLATGKIAWSRTFGTSADTAPLGIPLPGAFNLGGSANTAGGVTFIGAAMDNYLRAFDTTTGREIWKGRLPAGGQATPITYVSRKTGKQYVVIAAGGHAYMQTTSGDSVVAFTLP
ncbi:MULTISPECIES: membrane-bound PQQ-dependent dehydrogenase, glucose/quinate/shikimate family [Novosphingobium]|jgi:quinoprotein glucose dehydrogenase/quinate dehydrogenase (quinone)|uniref:membrane-bound PQQ-dependent dehydrogenase, glucose/quinate/shikimate family n=1 Tax=Novosphingobium TaxID=165696 RepID=UPI0022F2A17F|nr:membrane-bound PQQ-dependent dehydrogenase, glucose/quinate/shikimate family [Novosphingobium resinovorum]GLK45923.1 glucose dehydrogenase [Novosphingobium resinovorum]